VGERRLNFQACARRPPTQTLKKKLQFQIPEIRPKTQQNRAQSARGVLSKGDLLLGTIATKQPPPRQPTRAKYRPRPNEAMLRNANLQKFLFVRYGQNEWPDDDAGAGDLWLAIHSLTTAGKDDRAVRAFIKPRASWLSERDTVAMLDRAYAKPKPYSATKLGRELGLADVERTKYQLWHIEAIDISKAVRQARRKRNKAARLKARRREHGAVPHEISARRNRPWLGHGMGRRNYYQWIEKFEKAIAAQAQVACNNSRTKMRAGKLLLLARSCPQNGAGIVTALQSEAA